MSHGIAFPVRATMLAAIWLSWWWVLNARLSGPVNLAVVAGVVLTYPLAWLGRKALDRRATEDGAARTTTFVHCALGFTIGIPAVRALSTHAAWSGWVLPIPPAIGLALVAVTGAACALTVVNLAVKGLGAPFFIALSRRLTADWSYAWTRNPMVLTVLALGVSLGLWFRSALFLVWLVLLFAPALLFFVKVYEERELEIRFGESYRAYKARTPMLLPRRPRP